MKIPKPGDRVVLALPFPFPSEVPGATPVVPAGQLWTVTDIAWWPASGQFITFTLEHSSGVIAIVDATDAGPDGDYPLEIPGTNQRNIEVE